MASEFLLGRNTASISTTFPTEMIEIIITYCRLSLLFVCFAYVSY